MCVLDDVCATLHAQVSSFSLHLLIIIIIIIVIVIIVIIIIINYSNNNVILQSDGADSKLLEKLNQSVGSNDYYVGFSGGFTITHYAGQVCVHYHF